MSDKKEDIRRCAKELFSEKGFKDTSIADITKMAGMAVGTFYLYYPSKEKLFMEIFLEENEKLKRRITESCNLSADPFHVMKQMMTMNLSGMNSNPILRQWYDKDVFSKIERHFREEKASDYLDFMYERFIEVVKHWQTQGKVRNDIDARMIMAIFGALINIDMHKDEIGLHYFPQVLEYLAEFTMKGLMDVSPKSAPKPPV